jgi:hypothetical protein
MPHQPHAAARARPRSFVFVRRIPAALAATAVLVATAAQADASAPWTPSPAGRHRLALLVDEARLDLPLTQWPLPRGAVVRALDGLPAALPPLLDEARSRLRHELREHRQSRLSLAVRGRQEALPAFGDAPMPGSSVAWRSPALELGAAAMQLGMRIDEELPEERPRGTKARLDDTALALEAPGVQLQAWSHRSWWGPGWQNSLVLGHNTPPLTGISVQRAAASRSESPWLSWLGPWNFEFFAARMEDTGAATLVGMRLTTRPLTGLELGFTRTAQWGGYGRPRSFDSFLHMLAGRRSNPDTPAEQQEDPANAMAGIDLRVRCPASLRCAAYLQTMGEDEAGWAPSKHLALLGAEAWSADASQRYSAEFAATSCRSWFGETAERGCAYRNTAYPAGYTDAGRWVGAGIGPDSRVLTLAWMDVERGTTVRLHTGRIGAQVGHFGQTDDPRSAGPMRGLAARQGFRWRSLDITGELDWSRVRTAVGPREHARAGLQVRLAFE